MEGLVYIVCCWPANVCVKTVCKCVRVCEHMKARGPNKAEIDAVLGRESFLMVADIQLQKILHWTWKRSKPRTSNWEPKNKREDKTKEQRRRGKTDKKTTEKKKKRKKK